MNVCETGESLVNDELPRSRLYHLAPICDETPLIESLTSYISRLAWAYRISPRALVTEVIIPNLSGSYYFQLSSARAQSFFQYESMRINGVGEAAVDWAETLVGLTMRTELRLLTLYSWAKGLPNLGLLRATPAWCPECYAEWRETKVPVYQPLLWMLRVMTICLQHERQLEERCPYCLKLQSTLASNTVEVGCCTQCGDWLGRSPAVDVRLEVAEETLEWQRWVQDAINELREFGASTGPLPWERFSTGLEICIKEAGGMKKFSRLTATRPEVLKGWRSLKHTPSLERLLELCYVLNISPLVMLTTDRAVLKTALDQSTVNREPRPERPSPSYIDHDRVLEYMWLMLGFQIAPPSLNEVARRLRVTVRTLSYHFPQECSLITARYRAYRAELAKQRMEQKRNEVRQAVRTLHEQDIYPSYDRVKANLSDPNVMRRPEGHAAWHAARRELGIET